MFGSVSSALECCLCIQIHRQGCCQICRQAIPGGRGTWPKSTITFSNYMRLGPKFHCARPMIFFHPFHMQKSHQATIQKQQKRAKLPLHNKLSVGWWLVKTPLFLDFTVQVQLVKQTLKLEKMAEPIVVCQVTPWARHTNLHWLEFLSNYRPAFVPSSKM